MAKEMFSWGRRVLRAGRKLGSRVDDAVISSAQRAAIRSAPLPRRTPKITPGGQPLPKRTPKINGTVLPRRTPPRAGHIPGAGPGPGGVPVGTDMGGVWRSQTTPLPRRVPKAGRVPGPAGARTGPGGVPVGTDMGKVWRSQNPKGKSGFNHGKALKYGAIGAGMMGLAYGVTKPKSGSGRATDPTGYAQSRGIRNY